MDFWLLNETLNWEKTSHRVISNKILLDISIPYNLLISEIIKYTVKGQRKLIQMPILFPAEQNSNRENPHFVQFACKIGYKGSVHEKFRSKVAPKPKFPSGLGGKNG